jgi:hypothetical protein
MRLVKAEKQTILLQPMKRILILGSGYVGNAFATLCRSKSPEAEVVETSRKRQIFFDLGEISSWSNLPSKVDVTLWTFPAKPIADVKKFLDSRKRASLGKIIVVGSTGSYLVPENISDVKSNSDLNMKAHSLISEDAPLDMKDLRVQGEEEIRQHGGIVVRAAGIYGPQRNPLEWLRSGRVHPSEKLANFIHVEDLATILWAAMNTGQPGTNYIATDGAPHSWEHLSKRWMPDQWKPSVTPQLPSMKNISRSSKRVDGSATLKALNLTLKYPDVLSGVAALKTAAPET